MKDFTRGQLHGIQIMLGGILAAMPKKDRDEAMEYARQAILDAVGVHSARDDKANAQLFMDGMHQMYGAVAMKANRAASDL